VASKKDDVSPQLSSILLFLASSIQLSYIPPPDYESGRHSATPPSIVCLSGEAHTAKRRVWNRAMTSAAQREYEPLVARRAGQLVERLREQKGPLDFVKWIDLFSCVRVRVESQTA
jgi:cytochrome P450